MASLLAPQASSRWSPATHASPAVGTMGNRRGGQPTCETQRLDDEPGGIAERRVAKAAEKSCVLHNLLIQSFQ